MIKQLKAQEQINAEILKSMDIFSGKQKAG
jgi:hypothetical protein